MEDTIHHRQLRVNLASVLRRKDIKNEHILDAIVNVPRHLFLDAQYAKQAYEDIPLAIGEGQTISQPYTVAYQTQLLELQPHQTVLEIGTGSGYQAAILFEMGAEVYTIERQHSLYQHSRALLTALGYSGIRSFFGDGNEGLSQYAPFDRVLVTAAAAEIPPVLVSQLKVGGIMVVPVGGPVQKMLRVIKTSENATDIQEYDDFTFVPMLGGTVQK